MKKIILLLIPIILFSCSSDDSTENPIADQIIGKWFWGKEVYILEDNSEIEISADACTLLTSTEFKSDGALVQISYYEDNNSNCILETETLEYGNWTKLSENFYKIISKYPNEPEETHTENIEFITSTQFRYISSNAGSYNGQDIVTEYEYRNK